jgi:hypothetical protein
VQCPHCLVHFHDSWTTTRLGSRGTLVALAQAERCPKCGRPIILLATDFEIDPPPYLMVFPRSHSRAPVPPEVPAVLAEDYAEACQTLAISPKASAALCRRCLQAMLHSHGYKGRDLAVEVQMLLDEVDTTKAIPVSLRQTIDGIRHFGNFSAHPITEVTSLQIIDVEPHEAEQSLETVEGMFEHFYVQPELAKKRKADLDAKLATAGKKPSKS